MSSLSQRSNERVRDARLYIGGGIFFILVGLGLLGFTFAPVVSEEIKYETVTKRTDPVRTPEITPVDNQFGIVIPRLAANAPIIAEVDPFNETDYQLKLTRGVAHAKGSSLPGEGGRTFLFAHSAGDFYEANRYNAIFYLLYKLQTGDDLFIYYQGKKYSYSVKELRYVDPSEVDYLFSEQDNDLILMTCWPPGTTYRRLLVIAE